MDIERRKLHMNNLILGGAGFIGQHLTHKLLKTRQQRVTIVDNLSTGKINLDDFSEYKNLFEFVHADIQNLEDKQLLKLMRDSNRIFHFAGSVGVEHIDKDPSGTLFNNNSLTNKLLPLFKESKRHVIFSSTSEVYGNGPFNEEDSCNIGPSNKLRWGYAASKLMAEFLLNASGVPCTILRFFNIVGPGQLSDYGMVLPRFIEAAKKNDDIIVYGTGEQIRCFFHIDDATDAIIKCGGFKNELFNIGNDSPVTINELAKKVIELSGSNSKIVYVPYEKAFSKNHQDIQKRIPDITKLREKTGFKPKHNLDKIILDML
jgi:UDP-glucose 4-epimerase